MKFEPGHELFLTRLILVGRRIEPFAIAVKHQSHQSESKRKSHDGA
jgi:hypothetical protein